MRAITFDSSYMITSFDITCFKTESMTMKKKNLESSNIELTFVVVFDLKNDDEIISVVNDTT